MNDPYTQGFIDKCAESGVDPYTLAKEAQLLARFGPDIWERIKKMLGLGSKVAPADDEPGHPSHPHKHASAEDAPGYHPTTGDRACATCTHFQSGRCTKYNFSANPEYTCDSWS